MKRVVSIIIAVMMAAVLMGTCVYAEESDSAAQEAGEAAAIAEQGESDAESAGEEPAESAGEEAAEPAAEAAGESGGDSSGDSADSSGMGGEPDIEIEERFAWNKIEASGEQAELGYVDGTTILEAEGLFFKVLNKNGELDVYEDWRQDLDARAADLVSQMTLEEKIGTLFHDINEKNVHESGEGAEILDENGSVLDEYYIWNKVNNYYENCFLENVNGAPELRGNSHNQSQAIGEAARLGIPLTFSSDRAYNVWGGMIDLPFSAFAAAGDRELTKQLLTIYAKEMSAMKYQVTFNPSGVELGGFNGADAADVAELTALEVATINANGFMATAKHFIARGGNTSNAFEDSHNIHESLDSWLYPWQAVVDAGVKWIMVTAYYGLSGTASTYFDTETVQYLRNEMGYDGVIITDWGPLDATDGVLQDGTPLDTLSASELYAIMLNAGIDQFGGARAESAEGIQAVIDAINTGLTTEACVDEHVARVMRSKLEAGLFENAYVDIDAVLALTATEEYAQELWKIEDNAQLEAARNPEAVALEKQLMAKSTVLIKNEDNFLPLAEGIRVYVTGSSDATAEKDREAIAGYAEISETLEGADVAVARLTMINDAAELIVEDCIDAGIPLVVMMDRTSPDEWILENAAAVLYLSYSAEVDHGFGYNGIIRHVTPDVAAAMLFGSAEPEGMIVQEVARSTSEQEAQWTELAGDAGSDPYLRLIMSAMLKEQAGTSLPSNWGDSLLTYKYGMRYGAEPSFTYSTLLCPTETVYEEVYNPYAGSNETVANVLNTAQAGIPFTVYCLLWNESDADGITTVPVYDGDSLIAEKIMTVKGGSYRVVKIDIVIDTAGEHTLTVGDLTADIIVK